jgi:hypothetical protein
MTNGGGSGNTDDAHKVALEWLKHLITLCSGVLVISATFVRALFEEPSWTLIILLVSWGLLIASIITSLDTISRITGSRINNDRAWAGEPGRRLAAAARFCFISGITAFAAFALINSAIVLVDDEKGEPPAGVSISVEEVKTTDSSAVITLSLTSGSQPGGEAEKQPPDAPQPPGPEEVGR